MGFPARLTTLRLLPALALGCLFPVVALAQDAIVIACTADGCLYHRAYSPTLSGRDSVKTVAPSSQGTVPPQAKARTVKLASLPGLYRQPDSGLLRVMSRDGALGDLVFASKLPRGVVAGSPASLEWTIEFRQQAASKATVAVSREQVVAVIRGPKIEGALVDWLKREVRADNPHPLQRQIIAGGLAFAERSEELRLWRDEMQNTMRSSLEHYRTEAGDPARLEATLADGVAAMRIYQSIAPDAPDDTIQKELPAEHRRLIERFAIAGVLERAGMHDAFLEKLHQIGLARWSRPELLEKVAQALEVSARAHYERAEALSKAGQHAEAFDEAHLATNRAPCNDEMNEFYYRARVELVQRNMVPAQPEYDKENRTILQQIVRELQSMAQESTLTPELAQHVRRRIAEGERLDKNYLPLQLKKAEFLANAGELTASRDVVTRVERTVKLGRAEAEEWLDLDASLNGKLVTLRQSTEKTVKDLIGNSQFKDALDAAAVGLRAEPNHPGFLYWSAVAAAVLRDQEKTRQFAQRYLRPLGSSCTGVPDATAMVFDLYRRQASSGVTASAGGGTPNWISGERYPPGETFYDPISGSFNTRIVSSATDKVGMTRSTAFRWEGFLAASIRTLDGPLTLDRQPQLELEPVYDQSRVYMTGIGARANSEGRRRVMPLRYLNSPDFDPVLAAKFTPKTTMRGWAGNPFFHPFVWNDIYLFDLVYDELGRIKEAIPVAPDASRPVSSFSERLTFTWDGKSKRLLSIRGDKYLREMSYDTNGRLVFEKITHPSGRGKIEYRYQGDSVEATAITCEDDFFDRARRIVIVRSDHR